MDGPGAAPAMNAAQAGDTAGHPSFAFLMITLLAGQTAGTMGTTMIPSVAPKVAQTYGIPSALVGYQISLLACAMIVALAFGKISTASSTLNSKLSISSNSGSTRS